MSRRAMRLLLLGLLIGLASLYWGCSQPEDILADKSQTIFYLDAERLPSPPDGMIYQLCVAKTRTNDAVAIQDYVTIEKFGYDFETRTYLDTNGVARPDTNMFVFGQDVMTYSWILITVEEINGTSTDLGPVMLIDEITVPSDDPWELVFPFCDSLGLFTLDFNMETPSDGRTAASDGAGIWFSAYTERDRAVLDTLELRRFTIVTQYVDSFATGVICDSFIVNYIDSLCTVEETLFFGFDTLVWTGSCVKPVIEEVCDDGSPDDSLMTTLVTEMVWDTDNLRTFTYDDFVQTALDLPDYRRYGWKYKGWVVSTAITSDNSLGEMTIPAWRSAHDLNKIRYTPGVSGLLTTGTFHNINEADDSNPYVTNPTRVPNIPGEDFNTNLPGGGAGPIQLVPGGVTTGSVFVTLEPDNMVTSTTNFPLLLFMSDLPNTREAVETTDFQQFNMWHYGGTVYNSLVGFPQVHISIKRF